MVGKKNLKAAAEKLDGWRGRDRKEEEGGVAKGGHWLDGEMERWRCG